MDAVGVWSAPVPRPHMTPDRAVLVGTSLSDFFLLFKIAVASCATVSVLVAESGYEWVAGQESTEGNW